MGETGKGVAAVLGATVLWGLAVLYWKALGHVPAAVVLGHRSVWSLVFFGAYLALRGRLGLVGALLGGPQKGRVAFAAAMIAVNWFIFIWAIQVSRTVEASLGYYIYPLVSVLLGVLLYRERLGAVRGLAVALVALAVALLTWGLGAAPWVALVLAFTFAAYGLTKKRIDAGPITSVTAEVALATPFVLGWVWLNAGTHIWAGELTTNLLLIGAGPVTSVPLILFSYGARRLAMSATGVLFYINPTLQFLIAAVVFGEPVTHWHWLAFPLIWAGVALYSAAAIRQDRAARRRVISAGTSGSTVT